MNSLFLEVSKSELGKVGEKIKEQNREKMDLTELKEVIEFQKVYIEVPDIETARNTSLKSLLEENKEKKEVQAKKALETNEDTEGLTNKQKERLRELTDWSDEIISAINSWEEAELYMKAGLKEMRINGKKCLIRGDIDLEQKDEDGITNRERMERGLPPITKSGETVELHHIGQKANSPLAELTTQEHRGSGNDTVLHDKTKESEINRSEFGKERREHWKHRAS